MGLRDWLGAAFRKAGAGLGDWLRRLSAQAQTAPAFQQPDLGAPPSTFLNPHMERPEVEAPFTRETQEQGWEEDPDVAQWNVWHALNSSNVGEIRYLEDDILEVRFLSNYYYQYFHVAKEVFQAFLRADSPGKFVWNVLRAGGYEYVRIGAGYIPSQHLSGWRRWDEQHSNDPGWSRRLLPEEIEAQGENPSLVGQQTATGENLEVFGAIPMRKVPLRHATWRNNWIPKPLGE